LEEFEKLDLVSTFLIIFSLATLFQVTGVWQLIVIAGFFGGYLAKDYKTATLAGVLAFLSSWLLLFIALNLSTPANMALAFSFFSLFFVIGIVLTIVLALASVSVGYFLTAIYEERKSGKVRP